MTRAFGSANAAFAALGATLGAGAFAAGLKNVIDTADQLGKMSQKVGITVENLSALRFAAQLSDVEMGSFEKGLKKLAATMFEAATGSKEAVALFKGLNVEFESTPGKLKPTDTVLLGIADKFKGMADGAVKSALAVKVFGREGLALVPLLNQGAGGVQKLKEELEKLGGVFTGEMAQKAEQFNDNLKTIGVASQKLKIEMANNLLPGLSEVTEAMREAAKEGGLLKAIWVGLGGAAALATGATFAQKAATELDAMKVKAEQLRTAHDKLGVGLSPRSADLPDIQKMRMELAATEAQIAARLKEKIKEPKITPDASDFAIGKDKRNKELEDALKLMKKQVEEFNHEYLQGIDDRNFTEAQLIAEGQIRVAETLKSAEDLQLRQVLQNIDDMQERAIELEQNFALSANKGKSFLQQTEDAAKKTDDVARQLGLTFTSAFEDAVIGGKKLSDVLRSLALDLNKVFFRTSVTEPLLAEAKKLFKGFNLADLLKGGGGSLSFEAAGGPVSAGGYSVVGEKGPELVRWNQSGTVIPNDQLTTVGGGTVNYNFNFALGVNAAVRSEVNAMRGEFINLAQRAVQDQRNRNGDQR
jgi:hypothetical protein